MAKVPRCQTNFLDQNETEKRQDLGIRHQKCQIGNPVSAPLDAEKNWERTW